MGNGVSKFILGNETSFKDDPVGVRKKTREQGTGQGLVYSRTSPDHSGKKEKFHHPSFKYPTLRF